MLTAHCCWNSLIIFQILLQTREQQQEQTQRSFRAY